MAPKIITSIVKLLAVDRILSPPLSQLTPRAGGCTVSVLKMKKQRSGGADF